MGTPDTVKILIDLTRLQPGGENGGIKPALREIIRWLGLQSDPRFVFVCVANPSFEAEITPWFREHDRLVSSATVGADLAARENCDLVYCPFGFTDWSCPGIPAVTLIVDLLHLDFPESLTPADRSYREERFQDALRDTDVFQVISEYTSSQLQKYGRIKGSNIVRTYLAIHERFRIQPRIQSSRDSNRYFFYPANAWAHKNHETLLEAYSIYQRSAGTAAWRLVLTGHSSERTQKLKEFVKTLGLTDNVEFRGFVSEPQLETIWNMAGALVFPSLHEGLGIPLLEAMAKEVPIVASDATAIPEITGDAALLVNARIPSKLAESMQKIAEDASLRQILVQRGRKRIARFSLSEELNRLKTCLVEVSHQSARRRSMGYHPIDGLLEAQGFFGLPAKGSHRELSFTCLPLGIRRHLEFWCANRCIARIEVSADGPTRGRLVLPPEGKVLVLRVPDASSLNASDPRIHGVLLEKLALEISGSSPISLLDGMPS